MLHQVPMSNPQWYERFNKKVDIYESIGVTRQHKTLLEYVVQEAHPLTFYECTEEKQEAVHIYYEEGYLSYALLRQSGSQYRKLKVDL